MSDPREQAIESTCALLVTALIEDVDDANCDESYLDQVARNIVDALLAAGWRPPEPAEPPTGIFAEVQAERERAHAKHGDTSMESKPWDAERRLTILTEEVGEVARAYNEREHGNLVGDAFTAQLRSELIQCAAMATAWADVVPVPSGSSPEAGEPTP